MYSNKQRLLKYFCLVVQLFREQGGCQNKVRGERDKSALQDIQQDTLEQEFRIEVQRSEHYAPDDMHYYCLVCAHEWAVTFFCHVKFY